MAAKKSTPKKPTPKKTSKRVPKKEAGKKTVAQTTADDKGRVATVAAAMPDMEVGTAPPILGSRIRIWKQDPSVGAVGIRSVYLHTRIDAGPKDSQIQVEGLPAVAPDVHGDFLFEPSDAEAFDAAHTYAVVRLTLTMYQRLLGRKIEWRWNEEGGSAQGSHDPIRVFPRGGTGANAFYDRAGQQLRFFSFTPPGAAQGTPQIFTCRSLDIVGHEVGHAVLDSLQPGWLSSFNPPQTGGLHESFGDLSAIFLILSQLDLVDLIVSETKANLHQMTFLTSLAEQFGNALGRPGGLRNADNKIKLSEATSEVHNVSRVFTGAVYDILADAFAAARDPRTKDDCEVLYLTGQNVAKLVIEAMINSPGALVTFADVANEMIQLAEADTARYAGYAAFIRKHFEWREVIGPSAVEGPTAMPGMAPSRSGCCGTMQHGQYGNV